MHSANQIIMGYKLYLDFDKSIDVAAVHMLKGKQGDILRLPGVMYLDCSTNLALRVHDLYNHAGIKIHLLPHDNARYLVVFTSHFRNL